MNRLIKFRAWIDKYGYMIYSGKHKELEGLTFNNDGTITIHEGDGDQEYNSEDAHLMQFTGLFDVDGEMIWEGDILMWVSSNPFSRGEIRKVQINYVQAQFWCQGTIGVYLDDLLAREKCKVIGNIYQNKELLIELTSKK